jgi:hypothetical protein
MNSTPHNVGKITTENALTSLDWLKEKLQETYFDGKKHVSGNFSLQPID